MERRTSFSRRIFSIILSLLMVLSMLLYFLGGTFSNMGFELKASAAEITLTEPSTDGGVYQIGTAGELYWFADKVNNDNENYGSANAVLTADITVNTGDVANCNGTKADGWIDWTPIGNGYYNGYTGTFDGQNHIVSGLYFNDASAVYVGFFGYADLSGKIYNVCVVNSYFRAKEDVGGVCGITYYGTIENCCNTGTVVGTGNNIGGVCGYNGVSGSVKNCYNTGTVSGTGDYVGSVCGKNNESGTITNCYYLAESETDAFDGTTFKTEVQFNSGEVAYLLSQGENGSVWGQTIGTENYPVLGGDKVYYGYATCDENEEKIYSNTEITDVRPAHSYANGFCTVCDGYEPAEQNADGYYEIANAGQLYWFANYVNSGNTSVNAVLTADITVNQNVLNENGELNSGDFRSWTPIGYFNSTTDNAKYTGTFDGQNHTISGLYFNNTSTNYVGLFGYLNKGNVSNVGIVDSYIRGNDYIGGMCGYNIGTITNCYNTGIVKGSNNIGGMCGYSWNVKITNCYTVCTVSGLGNVGSMCGHDYGGTITNCYYLAESETDEIDGTTFKTEVQFNSGEVAYLLSQGKNGSVWGQTIGTENYPVLGGVTVYYAESLSYHNHTGNFCEVCDALEPNSEGKYEIANAGQLYWFANYVNSGNTSINAVLTADITVNKNVLNEKGELNSGDFTSWTPIGNFQNQYTGTFDGQNHTISGLYCNDENAGCAGLFGLVCENVSVSNVGVVDSYFKGKDYVGGVCGLSSGVIINCYNTGKVSGRDYIGGVCGLSNGEITNCYNTGEVSGRNYIGGVCGLSNGEITNCYNTGKVSGTSFVGGVCGKNNGTITNCYYIDTTTSDSNAASKTEKQFASGEVAYLLSQGENGSVWGQDLSTDDYPVLGGKKVLANVDQSAFANDIIIYGQNVTLDGTIGFNIYVSADENYNWDKTVNSVQGEEIENGLYKFTYHVAAKDMDKEIQFTVNDKIDATVSVSKYLDELGETDNESLRNLVNSMSAYGDAAKGFFSDGTVAEQIITDDLSVYDFTVGTMPDGISYYGSSLILESETTIRHYFKLDDGQKIDDFTFTVDSMTLTPAEKQGYYCIDIENVSAEKLVTSFNVSVNGEEVITNYSALSYANKVLDSDSTDDNLKNLVKALYIYNQNALAYNAA